MTRRARLALTLLAVALPAAGLLYRTYVSEAEALRFDAAGLPLELDGWRAAGEQQLGDEIESVLEPDLYLFRRYAREDGAALWAFVSFYGAADTLGAGAHDPAICYPSQGWELSAGRDVRLPLDGGGSLRMRELRADKAGRREVVLYWFQPVGRWPGRPEADQLLRVWDAVRGTPQYAFVRLSAPEIPGADTAALLGRFAARLAPLVRRTLETARPGEG